LIHLEVSGYGDPISEVRMFTYFYRLFDRYRKPVTVIVIHTDNQQNFCPSLYECNCLGTGLRFCFNTYKVPDQDEQLLDATENAFAIIIATTLIALKNQKNDTAQMREKLCLARKLREKNIHLRGTL